MVRERERENDKTSKRERENNERIKKRNKQKKNEMSLTYAQLHFRVRTLTLSHTHTHTFICTHLHFLCVKGESAIAEALAPGAYCIDCETQQVDLFILLFFMYLSINLSFFLFLLYFSRCITRSVCLFHTYSTFIFFHYLMH